MRFRRRFIVSVGWSAMIFFSLASAAVPAVSGISAGGLRGGRNITLAAFGPYGGSNDIPPNLAAAGITLTTITAVTSATLAGQDVLFLGRATSGVTGFEIDDLLAYVQAGGGIIGESEAPIRDSYRWPGGPYDDISTIFGVWSTQPDGIDYGWNSMNLSATAPSHPIFQGVSMPLSVAVFSGEDQAYIDVSRNPTVELIAQVTDHSNAPMLVAEYGLGRAVYIPWCPRNTTNWSSAGGIQLRELFINMVFWAAEGNGTPTPSPTATESPTPTITPTPTATGTPPPIPAVGSIGLLLLLAAVGGLLARPRNRVC